MAEEGSMLILSIEQRIHVTQNNLTCERSPEEEERRGWNGSFPGKSHVPS